MKTQIYRIRQGFLRIIPAELIDNISAQALRLLVEGEAKVESSILQGLVKPANFDEEDQRLLHWFWDIVHAWSAERVKKLLRFVTASDRLPIGCNKHRNPAFTIRAMDDEETRLPTSSTCAKKLW